MALVKSTGSAACLLGKTWGYDDAGVWVADGCGGEFLLGPGALRRRSAGRAGRRPHRARRRRTCPWRPGGSSTPARASWSARESPGSLSISGYGLVRYMNQTPGEQTFTDHLGNERTVDGRNDIYPHRVMVFFMGCARYARS